MSFETLKLQVPEKRRDRLAVASMLAIALPGLAISAWLLVHAIYAMPVSLLDSPFSASSSALAQWQLDVKHLLLVIPFGAAMVLFARLVIGTDTFGIFTPMLLALALLQMGLMFGLALLGIAMATGAVIAPLLERLKQPRMAMMAVLIGVVVSLLYSFKLLADRDFSAQIFPVVVTAMVIERWWVSRVTDGAQDASRLLVATILIAIGIKFIMASPPLRWIASEHPLLLIIASTCLALLLGLYRGLRLSELFRFQPILAEPASAGSHDSARN